MIIEPTLVILGCGVQIAGAMLFAAVLRHFELRDNRDYLHFWIWSWLAFAVYTFGVTVSRLLPTTVAFASPERITLTALALSAGFLQVIWFLLGTYEFAARRRLTDRWLLPTCGVALVMGLVVTLAFIDDPAARTARYLARVGVRSVVTGVGFVIAALWLARLNKGAWTLGRGLLPVALIFYGMDQIVFFVLGLPLQGAFDDFQRVQLAYGYVDVLLLLLVGLGMLLWMLEKEREDRLANWERIAASQRLEAIGRLAAGVAHDFNNLLTAIGGNADLALMDLPDGHDARPFLDEIRGATQRAVSVTRQLLAVGRKNPVQPAVLDLNDSVTALGGMLRRLIGKDVVLEVRPSPVPALVSADPGLLDQVLLNLAVNARGAMPAGGQLTIAVSVLSRDDAPFACISVTDTGSGIAAEHLPHIFEPFFTTKEMGEGTGLGLATSYAVVQQHGGRIEVDTEVGKGSTFHIYLPVPVAE
ncbi:MAG: ATP-binding protein [Vicinamibacterales bacterium]